MINLGLVCSAPYLKPSAFTSQRLQAKPLLPVKDQHFCTVADFCPRHPQEKTASVVGWCDDLKTFIKYLSAPLPIRTFRNLTLIFLWSKLQLYSNDNIHFLKYTIRKHLFTLSVTWVMFYSPESVLKENQELLLSLLLSHVPNPEIAGLLTVCLCWGATHRRPLGINKDGCIASFDVLTCHFMLTEDWLRSFITMQSKIICWFILTKLYNLCLWN